jgi:hypothetical protein
MVAVFGIAVAGLLIGSPAQNVTLSESIERTVSANEPEWRLDEDENRARGKLAMSVWKLQARTEARAKEQANAQPAAKKGDEAAAWVEPYVSVQTSEYKTEADARKALAMERVGLQIGFPVRLEGVGDEAYIWEQTDQLGYARIQFRRADLVVVIIAPSKDLALRFTSHVEEGVRLHRDERH